ncbi:MAG TPA: phosphohydrolase [Syntrophobacteraceae bacterium]|nr:phosphohydrolase [Syntrophobacteraceae bacterium]
MKCPGQDSRFWQPGAIFESQCPNCGQAVEFFKDESTRRCKQCGHKFVNPKMDFGCASYCKFAAQCLGDLPPELMAKRDDLLRDRVAIEMKKYFKQDFKRIGHATRVARYAEQIVKAERGEPAIVISAAYLHDIGIKEAERKFQSTGAEYQEQEGPPIAREILDRLGARTELIDEVCDIIAHHHHPREEETVNFKCVYDADLIVNVEENVKENPLAPEKIVQIIEKSLLTETGKTLAMETFKVKS